MNCKTCGKEFHRGQKRWCILWDGERYWIMMPYVEFATPLGPYHGGPCISAELDRLNTPHHCDRCRMGVTYWKGYWWSSDDDFMCPDGEERHSVCTQLT